MSDLNRRPTAYKAVALPTELNRLILVLLEGVEPSKLPYQESILPLNYRSISNRCTLYTKTHLFGSPAWDRTTDNLINSQALYQLSYWGIKLVPYPRFELGTKSLSSFYATAASIRQIIWLRIWVSNPANHWLTVKSLHHAWILRNKLVPDIWIEQMTFSLQRSSSTTELIRLIFGASSWERSKDLCVINTLLYHWANEAYQTDVLFIQKHICLAPQDGIEPPTKWLTVTCSTAELLGNKLYLNF